MLICYQTNEAAVFEHIFIQTTIKKGNIPEKKLEQKTEQHTFCPTCPTTSSLLQQQQHLVRDFWRKNVAPFMESSSDSHQLKL